MNADQLAQLLDELRGLYPDWTCTAAERTEWTALLNRYDYQVAKAALRTMWRGSNYKRPSPGRFTNAAEPMILHGQPTLYENNRLTGTWILCVEAPPQFPSRKGWAIPLICHGEPAPNQELQAQASSMLERHRKLYEGLWVILHGQTCAQVADRIAQLCPHRMKVSGNLQAIIARLCKKFQPAEEPGETTGFGAT